MQEVNMWKCITRGINSCPINHIIKIGKYKNNFDEISRNFNQTIINSRSYCPNNNNREPYNTQIISTQRCK